MAFVHRVAKGKINIDKMTKLSKPRTTARQTSIYRTAEELLGDILAMTERIPKNASGLQFAGARAVSEMLETLSATEFAVREQNPTARLSYIASIIHSMTIVKTICRELYDYSRKERSETITNDKGEQTARRVPRFGRVVSHVQYVHLLEIFSKLSREIGRWYNATSLKIVASKINT